MEKYDSFKEHIVKAAESFKQFDKNETIRVVSHLDADGISSASIMVSLLNQDNRRYSISIVPQLSIEILNELALEPYKQFIFTDLGSGQISSIKKKLHDRNILILDHHEIENDDNTENIIHVNPHLFDIDGSNEISGAGVTYLFAKAVNEKFKDHAHIAVIGAIGDIQEDNGFSKLNDEILNTAIENGTIELKKGLNFFGAQTKPLYKLLEYSSKPYIPGVSGSESNAIEFLVSIGISPRTDTGWKKITDLRDDELKKLADAIIMKRNNEKNPADIFGNIYTMTNERSGSPTKDAREFSTLLNACGRLNKASIGIGTCLGDRKSKQRAMMCLSDYKREIVKAINWYKENKDSSDIIKDKGYMIINAQDKIPSTIIGTLASILSKSNELTKKTYIMSLARALDGTTKVSLRLGGIREEGNIDLRKIITKIAKSVDGQAGGHTFAAGAIIESKDEEKFIETSKQTLSEMAMEEIIT